jgi:hypothetical protein
MKEAEEHDTQVTISLRVPVGLKARLEKIASEQDRTLSAESERRLRRSLHPTMLAEDAVNAMAALGGLRTTEGRDFLQDAMVASGCDKRAAQAAIWFAFMLTVTRTTDRVSPGAKLQIWRPNLDSLKAEVRELEQNAVVVDEKTNAWPPITSDEATRKAGKRGR